MSQSPHISPADPLQTSRSDPRTYEVTALLPWVPVHARPCVCPPGVELLFPPVLWHSCTQAPLDYKAKCSGGCSSWCQTPRLGSLMWDSVLWENFHNIIVLQFVGHHLTGMGFDYIVSVPFLPSHWVSSCLWMYQQNIFFGRFTSFLLTVGQHSVVTLVGFYPAILSP